MTLSEQLEETTTSADEDVVYCTVHPNVETTLRCNRCGRPMCTRCAVRTPVGYRCKECVRQQQDKFFDAQMIDYLIAGGVSLVASFFAAFILANVSWFILMFFIAPAVGGVIGSIVYALTRKRRGRHTATVVGVCVVVAALPFLLVNPLSIGIYLFMATGTAVARFRLRL